MAKELSRIIPLQCECCGHHSVRGTITRERGAGAEITVVCPECSHEEWWDVSESQVELIATLGMND